MDSKVPIQPGLLYTIRRAKKGALVIAPEKSQSDIFDLPSNELKKLVQGFIWRDEHFTGKDEELRAVKLEREFRIAKVDLQNFLESRFTTQLTRES